MAKVEVEVLFVEGDFGFDMNGRRVHCDFFEEDVDELAAFEEEVTETEVTFGLVDGLAHCDFLEDEDDVLLVPFEEELVREVEVMLAVTRFLLVHCDFFSELDEVELLKVVVEEEEDVED